MVKQSRVSVTAEARLCTVATRAEDRRCIAAKTIRLIGWLIEDVEGCTLCDGAMIRT